MKSLGIYFKTYTFKEKQNKAKRKLKKSNNQGIKELERNYERRNIYI